MLHDLRQAFRTIATYPLFSTIVVVSLALGIGANTAVFSLLDQAILRTLPIREPEQLAVFHVDNLNLRGTASSDNYESVFSLDMARQLRTRTDLFEGVAVRGGAPPVVLNGSTNEYVSVEFVSGDLLPLLGVGAALGRPVSPEDDRAPGEHPVAMLTYTSWTERFGADPQIVGHSVRLSGLPFTIIGVLPRNFYSPVRGNKPALLVPVAMQRVLFPDIDGTARDVRWVNVFARLRPGVTAAQATSAISPTWSAILEGVSSSRGKGQADPANRKLQVLPASRGINPLNQSLRTPLLILMFTVAAVLLIACVNIAGLLLARAAARQRDTAIRLSLGAGRLRILRQSLTENLVLAAAGCGLGIGVASLMTAGLLKLSGEGSGSTLRWELDGRVVLFALAVCLLATLLFGAIPALQLAGSDLARSLQNRSLPASHATVRKLLVGAQIALATLLLSGAGLFLRSLNNVMQIDPGFRAERLVQFDINPRQAGYDKVRGTQLYNDLEAKLKTMPGVTAAGGSYPGPLSGNNRGTNLTVEGFIPQQGEEAGANQHATVPGFFHAVGVMMLAGREFTEADRAGGPSVIIVNEAFANKYCGGNCVGRKVAWGSGRVLPNMEIVGVVRNLRNSLRDTPVPDVYIPHGQETALQRMTFFVRTAGEDRAVSNAVRATVRSLDPNLPVDNVQTMRERIASSAASDRVLAILCSAFACVAVLLTALGVYGVIAWTVARRTQEIAVRIALGALPGRVLGLVLRELAVVAAISVAVGTGLSVAGGDFAQSRLYGVQGRDFSLLVTAALVSLAVATLATTIPALRATRIRPATALREE